MRRYLTAIVSGMLALAAQAQGVALSGVMGQRALLVIDGQTQVLAVGASARGVKLLELRGDEARIERDGKSTLLRVGAAPVSMGAPASSGGGSEIVMTAGSGGHFVAEGSINGRAVRFMVDTGATSVAMSIAEAEHIGLNYHHGQRMYVGTANGNVPAYKVRLAEVRVGDVVVYDIEAMVVPAQMEFILLGNSFLTRFQMKRENETMTLSKRF